MEAEITKAEPVDNEENTNQKVLETSEYGESHSSDKHSQLLVSQAEILHDPQNTSEHHQSESLNEAKAQHSILQESIIGNEEKKAERVEEPHSTLTWSVLKPKEGDGLENNETSVKEELKDIAEERKEDQSSNPENKAAEKNEQEEKNFEEKEEIFDPAVLENTNTTTLTNTVEKKEGDEEKIVAEGGENIVSPENTHIAKEQPAEIEPINAGNDKLKSDAEFSLLTNERLLKKATELKDSARENIQKKDYEGAIKIYEEALQVIHPNNFKNSQPHIMKELISLTVMLMNNLSLCYYNIGQARRTLDYADQALMIDQKNIKASYRKALVYKNLMNDIERAFEFIKLARKAAFDEKTKNDDIEREYVHIKQLYLDYKEKNKEKQKELYSRMLSNPEKKKEKKEGENTDKSANVSNNSEVEPSDSGNSLKKMFWLFPSSIISLGVTNYLLKQKIKSSTGTCSIFFLTCSLAGAFASKSNYLKASSLGASLLYILYNLKAIKK